ncbi:MAG TPA: ABC transporter permease [Gemmatimonadaceae bacterium]|jgi:predicted permease
MPRSFRLTNSKRDVAEEIGFHLEMRTREFIERGMSPEEARRAAAAWFGDVAAIEAACRDERDHRAREHARRDWLQGVGLDLKVALRSLWRRPAFTAAATLTLALGIGAAAAVFAIVSGVLLRPLPYRDPARLVMLWFVGPDVRGTPSQMPLSAPTYLDIVESVPSLGPSAAFRSWPLTLSEGAEPEQVAGVRTTPGLFATLGIRPAIGRDFTVGDAQPGAPRVAIISDGLWRRRWAGDPSILGKSVTLSGERCTIIGIAPRGLSFPRGAELPSGLQFPTRTEVWTPLTFTDSDLKNRWTLNLAVVARRRDAGSTATTDAQLAALSKRLDAQFAGGTGRVQLYAPSLAEQAAAPVQRTLLVLLGAVALVLVIACVNVTSLLIARTSARGRELAVRTALGAGATRLGRQLVIENVLLALLGAAAGVVLAAFATRVMLALVPGQLPRADDVSLDWRVLVAAAVCALAAGTIFGIAAAIHARGSPLAPALTGGSARATGSAARTTGRRILVGAQIALSLVLLVAAGLLGASFVRLQHVDPGFHAEGAVSANVALPIAGSFNPQRDGPGWSAFFTTLTDRAAALPNVVAAGAVSVLPLTADPESAGFTIEGRPAPAPGQAPETQYFVTAGDYFRAMGIRLQSGRTFNASDRAETPRVIVVSRELERRLFPGDRAIGHRIHCGCDFTPGAREIIGVVDDVRASSLDEAPTPAVYLPEAQMTYPQLVLVMRTKGDPIAVLPSLRRELRALRPDVALELVRTLRDVFSASLARQRFSLVLIGAFALAALALAVVGLYGVIALSVGERRREIGVRLALGARPATVLALVLGEGARIAVVGIVAGLLVSSLATRLLRGMLYDVTASDVTIYAAAAVLVAVIALVSTWAPARAATKVDPVVALRSE